MWIAIVLPPLLVPQALQRPDHCPACQTEGALRVHQRLKKRIPYVSISVDARQGWPSESHVRGVRFSCRACNRTFTTKMPDQQRGSLASAYVAAYVVTWYCLGLRPSAIYQKLADYDLEMSRASIYRFIAKATDPAIRELHRTRRNKFESLTVYSMDRHRPELCDVHPLSLISAEEDQAEQAMVRSTALVCKIYGNVENRLTVEWLDAYLRRFKLSGILAYPDLRSLEKSFNPDEFLSRRAPAVTSLLGTYETNRPPDSTELRVKAIVASAARLAQIAPESEQPLPNVEDVFDRL